MQSSPKKRKIYSKILQPNVIKGEQDDLKYIPEPIIDEKIDFEIRDILKIRPADLEKVMAEYAKFSEMFKC